MLGSLIPKFNHEGLLPPFGGLDPTRPAPSSPYSIDIPSLIDRFAFSKKRIEILRGFLKLRNELNLLGFRGHQWLDGSFVEAKDAPNDIDVVTFYFVPDPINLTLEQAEQHKIQSPSSKTLLCDSYLIYTGPIPAMPPMERQASLLKTITYWHNLFSHTRSSTWKGILEIALDPTEDIAAHSDLLDQMESKI